MSTNALIKVYDDYNNEIVLIYCHSDGYPESLGKILLNFSRSKKIVNGIKNYNDNSIANGMECFAAQLVCHLKTGPGHIYLYPQIRKDSLEDYIYSLHFNKKTNLIDVICFSRIENKTFMLS